MCVAENTQEPTGVTVPMRFREDQQSPDKANFIKLYCHEIQIQLILGTTEELVRPSLGFRQG